MATANLKSIGVGVIGVGGMGTRHARNIHRFVKGAHVAGLYDVDDDRTGELSAVFDNAPVFDSPLALINDEKIDAVIIASPDHTHVDFTLRCLEVRKPVLCEKPLATTAEEARPIIEAEKELGRPLITVGFMRRYDPQHVELKEKLDSGRIGRPRLYKGTHRNRSVPPASSGEHYISQAAVHDIDAARWLLGTEVEQAYVRGARVDPSLDEKTHDLMVLTLSMTDDTLAAIEVYLSARYGYEVTAEVVGEKGSISTLPSDRTVTRTSDGRSVEVHGDWLERFEEAYILEVRHWIDHVRSDTILEAGATAWDGYIGLVVADACIESLISGEPVSVDLPVMPDFYSPLRHGDH